MPHKSLLFSLLIFVGGLLFSQEEKSKQFSFKWDNGFKLTTPEEKFALKFGGRIMLDHGYFFQDDSLTANFGPLQSKTETELRRARLFVSGDIHKNLHFKFQLDFAGEEIGFKDVYIGASNIPIIGNMRVGHFKDPFRLSTLTSSKYITFMEVGQNEAFALSRNNGIIVFNDFLTDRVSAQFAAFRNANNTDDYVLKKDGYALTGRITGLAVKNDEKRQLLHLGIAYSYRKPESKIYRVSAKPSSNMAPKYVSTGTIKDVADISLINFETAYVQGPFSFQGEYLNSKVNTISSSLNFANYYGELSYFITGESKKFKGSYESFDRLKPNRDFNKKDRGPGAWEVALRYSNTDLTDKIILGGVQKDIALALNWYPNPITRLMLNYIWVDIQEKGQGNILQGRIQIDF